MAARLGLSMKALRDLDPAACETDLRLMFKSGDEWNLSIRDASGAVVPLRACSIRDLRLLARQLDLMADRFEQCEPCWELIES